MRAALAQKNATATPTRPGQQREEPQRAHPFGLWYKDTVPDAARLGQAADWDEPLPEPPHAQRAPSAEQTACSSNAVTQPRRDGKDVIDCGLISMATARRLFETYKQDLFPHYPLVAIPPSTTAETMRETKPALFLAVVAAASGKENPDLSAALDKPAPLDKPAQKLGGCEAGLTTFTLPARECMLRCPTSATAVEQNRVSHVPPVLSKVLNHCLTFSSTSVAPLFLPSARQQWLLLNIF